MNINKHNVAMRWITRRRTNEVAGLYESFPGTFSAYQEALSSGFQGTMEEFIQIQSIPQGDRSFTGKVGGLVEPGVTHYGQLVQPGPGRPGYAGDDTVVDRVTLRYKYDDSVKQKLNTLYDDIKKYKSIHKFPTKAKTAVIKKRLTDFATEFKKATGRLPVRNEIRAFGVASQSVTTGKKATYLIEGKNFMEESALQRQTKRIDRFTPETPIVKEAFDYMIKVCQKTRSLENLRWIAHS